MQREKVKISLAIATYNGAAFILDQLESIFRQTRLVDEVVICDDGSTDETPELVRDFIRRHGLEDSWYYYINDKNKGPALNFVDCALITTGDIIFYCDQDDVWYADKVERMLNVFIHQPQVKLLSCDTDIVDAKGKSLRTSYSWQKAMAAFIKRDKLIQISFCAQMRSNNDCPGHEMAFRREVIEAYASVIKKSNLSHDNPLGFIMSAKGNYYRLHTKLMKRRLHSDSTSAPQYNLVSRVRRPDCQIRGREMQVRYIEGCYDAVKYDLSEMDKKQLSSFKRLTKNSCIWIKEKRYGELFLSLFNPNPMINRTIMAINLLCSFSSEKSQVENFY